MHKLLWISTLLACHDPATRPIPDKARAHGAEPEAEPPVADAAAAETEETIARLVGQVLTPVLSSRQPPPPIKGVVRSADEQGAPWLPARSYEEAAAALSPTPESIEYIFLLSEVQGVRLLAQGTWLPGDGTQESHALFSPEGRLLHYREAHGGYGDICGGQVSTVTVSYPTGERAIRAFTHTINDGEPLNDQQQEHGCAEDQARLEALPDPGWGPRWLMLSDLPTALSL